ncbi:MAG: cytochrome D1 domain-containing protein, partial [Bacteroidota bacterium]
IATLSVAAVGSSLSLEHLKTIRGNIAPKSIVYSGAGLFFAQNMMYRHTITVYDRTYKLVGTISDRVDGSMLGSGSYNGLYQGAPVEAAFSHGGKYAWVSNYRMYGAGFDNPGNDSCFVQGSPDHSYLYRLNTENFTVDRTVAVGAVPKYVATTPDDRLVLVSNWCSGDLSVVDAEKGLEVKRIKLGRYPRGIVVDERSTVAYIAVMGSYDVAVVSLLDNKLEWIRNVGRSPRHLVLDAGQRFLYASLNGEEAIAKVDLSVNRVVKRVTTGLKPRSIALSGNGEYLYVVNYESNTLSKVRCETMEVVRELSTDHHPIGVTVDPETNQVWVACYSGSIMIFQD